ncbi:MAG: hypothetical protein Q7W16_00010 [Coriobacteriia bacterium]|nr:hypothetical protein [Coriobacteriia bacterium]
MSRPIVRRLSALALVLALAVPMALPVPASAVRTVGISAPTFDFNVAAGQTGKGELYVINDGTEPIKVMVYSANQKTDAKGKVTYEVPKFGEPGFSGPATWFRIQMPQDSKAIGNTPYLEMKPKQRVLVKFNFEVPNGVAAGDHQVLIFFEMFDFAQGGGMLSTVSGRVGSRVRVRVQGTLVEKLTIQPFNVRGLVIGDLMPYDFVVRNDGNVDKTVSAKLEILDAGENVLQKSTVMTETTLYSRSMSEQSASLALMGVGIGKFTARLTATYPKEPDAQGEAVPVDIVKDRTIWVFPLWLVIGVVVLVGGLVLWLTWRGAVAAAGRAARTKRGGRGRRPRSDAGPADSTVSVAEPIEAPEPQAPARPTREGETDAAADAADTAAHDPSFPRNVELWSDDEDSWA